MKLKDLRALERPLKVVEAHDRLAKDDVKGLTIQVIFEGTSRGGADAPVQMFIPYDDDGYATIMGVMQPKLDAAKADADAKIAAFAAKAATPVTPDAPVARVVPPPGVGA